MIKYMMLTGNRDCDRIILKNLPYYLLIIIEKNDYFKNVMDKNFWQMKYNYDFPNATQIVQSSFDYDHYGIIKFWFNEDLSLPLPYISIKTKYYYNF
jgi:hypothetical protein